MMSGISAKAVEHVPRRSSQYRAGGLTAGYLTQIMAVDLLGPLPESAKGNHYVMVVGDYFSCWMEALPIRNQEASAVAEKLVDEVSQIFITRAIACRPRATI